MTIYPGITTTNRNWRDRIKEVKKSGLTEISFFPTCLKASERQESYDLLIKAGIKKIPFIHLRTDMDADEINYLINQFKTKVFNIHTIGAHKMDYNLSAFSSMIYIENQAHRFADNELKSYAGICIDFSHLENARLNKMTIYDYFMDLIGRYPCGCAHVNAIKNKPINKTIWHYDYHKYDNLSDFDYLAKYKDLIPNIVALELENSISEQLKAKDYIEKLITA
ncbi:MAG: hypothetical protein AAB969_03770 [Patescibacteria group bacterium]|mgnify:CR=1 FL=1